MTDRPPGQLKCVEATGPGRFVTRRVYHSESGEPLVWSSRHHRKRLAVPALDAAGIRAAIDALLAATLRCLWMPRCLNWWIGVVFAAGSLLFALGSVLALWPELAAACSLDSAAVAALFFAGSIPFTLAAWLQLFQAANTPALPHESTPPPRRKRLIGWRPHDIGWLSAALQFVGTLLFNLNTYDALIPSLSGAQQELAIWAPDLIGSVLFLVSGYLAFIEICHTWWRWQWGLIAWWVTMINLLGCVGFMISAGFASPTSGSVTLATAFTLQGALCFLVGSSLLLPETAEQRPARSTG